MRDYAVELEKRVTFIRNILGESHADGIIFGNSGGKDSALAGILCKKACDNTLGVLMPCQSKRNYEEDTIDALEVAKKFGIETITVDLTDIKNQFEKALAPWEPTGKALSNINPRLRMTTLYALGQTRNMLVCGTGNRSEIYMGYFTKWGDGAFDFNPIADLTVTEIYEFLRYLGAPDSILQKAPSAALFEGQTDETEMGVTYESIDRFLQTGSTAEEDMRIIEQHHTASEHKRNRPSVYGG